MKKKLIPLIKWVAVLTIFEATAALSAPCAAILIDADTRLHPAGLTKWCCQTNEPKHQYSFDEFFYEVTKERHSVRAASRLSLKVQRFESDLCELKRL
jgi:hypothetical protein